MKTIKYLSMVIVAMFSCFSFTACSSDDDNDSENNSGKASTFTIVDGRKVVYKYTYVIPSKDGEYGDANGIDSYELCATTEDLLYYRKNPSKLKDGMLYSIMSIDVDAAGIGSSQTNFNISVSYDNNLKRDVLFEDDFDDDDNYPIAPTHIWYTSDSDLTSSLTVNKSGKTFTIESTELPVWASEMGGDDGIDDSSARKTTCTVAFSSNNYVTYSSRSTVVVVTDKSDRLFLKSLKSLRKKK